MQLYHQYNRLCVDAKEENKVPQVNNQSTIFKSINRIKGPELNYQISVHLLIKLPNPDGEIFLCSSVR